MVRELDAGNPPVQFDERGVETEPSATAPLLDSTLNIDVKWAIQVVLGQPIQTIPPPLPLVDLERRDGGPAGTDLPPPTPSQVAFPEGAGLTILPGSP